MHYKTHLSLKKSSVILLNSLKNNYNVWWFGGDVFNILITMYSLTTLHQEVFPSISYYIF